MRTTNMLQSVLWTSIAVGLCSCAEQRGNDLVGSSTAALAAAEPEAKPLPKISPPVQRMVRLARASQRAGDGFAVAARAASAMSETGDLNVMVYSTSLTGPEQEADLVALGARVVWRAERSRIPNAPTIGAIQALIPFDMAESVADLPWVASVHATERPKVNIGAILSEGVAHLQADRAQAQGITGTGVTVGVISDGVTNMATSQASGDLPAACPATPCITALSTGGGDEGTAMLEIVADMAPGANLLFNPTTWIPVQHTAARDALVAAGATVIAEDIPFDQEPVFQEGWVAQHIDTLAGNGISVHSSSGNLGDRHARRVAAIGRNRTPNNVVFNTVPPPNCNNHTPNNVVELGPNQETVIDVTVYPNPPGGTHWNTFELQWSEPRDLFPTLNQGGFTNLDMFLMADDLQSCITLPADGGQANGQGDTLEVIEYSFNGPNPVNAKLVINVAGTSSAVAAPTLDLRWRGIDVRNTSANIVSNVGSLDPQNNFLGLGFSVGATDPVGTLQTWHGRGGMTLGSTTVCPGGAAGPCVGVAGAPMNVQIAPTIVASQGNSVFGSGGFGGPAGVCPGTPTLQGQCVFSGTSSSAPHAAGCDALLRQLIGAGVTLADVRNRMTQTATRLGAGVPNDDAGFGEINCWEALGGPTARCRDPNVAADATCHASVTTAMIDNGSSDPFGDSLTPTLSSTGPFGLGPHTVTLTVSDGRLHDSCDGTVTVQDQTAPDVTPPANMNAHICGTSESIYVGEGTASDNCVGSLTATGKVVQSNGVTLPTPIPVVGGYVTLGAGTHLIEWTASDGTNPPTTRNQTVVVAGRIQAGDTFLVDSTGYVKNIGGAPGAVMNSGSGQTAVLAGGSAGPILSVAPVHIYSNGWATGGITSSAGIQVDPGAHVTGTVNPFTTVSLPGLPTLPTFPPPSSVTIPPINPTTPPSAYSLAPGSYSTVTVNSGDILELSAGDYYFTDLTLNSAATIRVNPTTRVFVNNTFAYRSPFVDASNAVQPIYLGFAGTSLIVEATFKGTLVAPNGHVQFGTSSAPSHYGEVYAKKIEVRSGATLYCDEGVTPPPPTPCTNGTIDPGETDIDCGGTACAKCATGKDCLVNSDCQSNICTGGVCQDPPTPPCTEATAVDLGAPGNNVTVPANGCVRVKNGYPSWWGSSRTMKLEGTSPGNYPVPFTWSNTCSMGSGGGMYTADWQAKYFGNINSACATVIDLQGSSTGQITLRYWAN